MPKIDKLISTGVYLIRNKHNNKVYIGSTTRTIKHRIKSHFKELRKGTHVNRYLQHAWNKHGSEMFTHRVLKRCEPSDCLRYEQIFINKYKSHIRASGYNICPTAGNLTGVKWPQHSKLAKKMRCRDPKFVERVREIFKRPKTEEHREKLRQALLGRSHQSRGAEANYRMGSANRGKKMSAEKRAHMSASAKERWRKHREQARQVY